jgi:hypothetical protein
LSSDKPPFAELFGGLSMVKFIEMPHCVGRWVAYRRFL